MFNFNVYLIKTCKVKTMLFIPASKQLQGYHHDDKANAFLEGKLFGRNIGTAYIRTDVLRVDKKMRFQIACCFTRVITLIATESLILESVQANAISICMLFCKSSHTDCNWKVSVLCVQSSAISSYQLFCRSNHTDHSWKVFDQSA